MLQRVLVGGRVVPGTIVKSAGNKDYEISRLKDLNHLFQTCQTGEPEEYLSITETFAPVALKTMSDWLRERLKK